MLRAASPCRVPYLKRNLCGMVMEFMFVFGDAARLVWQGHQTHKFLVHKFLKWYFCHRTATVPPASPADGLDTGNRAHNKNHSKLFGDDRQLIVGPVLSYTYLLTVRRSRVPFCRRNLSHTRNLCLRLVWQLLLGDASPNTNINSTTLTPLVPFVS